MPVAVAGTVVAKHPVGAIHLASDVAVGSFCTAAWVAENWEPLIAGAGSLWGAGVVASGAAWVARRECRTDATQRRDRIWPALARLIGADPELDDPRDFLTIPVAPREDDAAVTVRLPDGFTGEDRQVAAIGRLINRRVPGQWVGTADWETHTLTLRHPAEPPKHVEFARCRDVLLEGDIHQLPIGVASGGRVVRIDLDADAPHIALIARTRSGKSTLLRFIIGYSYYHGARDITVCDSKGTSLGRAFDGVPGVNVVRHNIEQISQAIIDVGREMSARIEINSMTGDEEWPGDYRVLVIEECTATMDEIRDHWKETKEKGLLRSRQLPALPSES
ncbi:hypothetical protein [Frankia sp. CiP3]|uniref:hypothetical protein n=1 Tax=Frankia sp. CiP3 TaxID=2880971 RepID=UPI001EF6D35B|nr:hypothetical protein [Frankia sp. CiP3]